MVLSGTKKATACWTVAVRPKQTRLMKRKLIVEMIGCSGKGRLSRQVLNEKQMEL